MVLAFRGPRAQVQNIYPLKETVHMIVFVPNVDLRVKLEHEKQLLVHYRLIVNVLKIFVLVLMVLQLLELLVL